MIKSFSVRRTKWNSGTSAVEFAMIAPVFLLLFFSILETGLWFFANLMLDNAVKTTGRLIRTGQVQGQNMSQAGFRNEICTRVNMIMSCGGDVLLIDVRSFSNFGAAAFPPPLDHGNLSNDLNNFNPGASSKSGQSSIVLVRAFYKWKFFTPLIGQYFSNMAGDVRLISSSAAFKNEPF